MKKYTKVMALLFVAVTMFTFASCSEDEKEFPQLNDVYGSWTTDEGDNHFRLDLIPENECHYTAENEIIGIWMSCDGLFSYANGTGTIYFAHYTEKASFNINEDGSEITFEFSDQPKRTFTRMQHK